MTRLGTIIRGMMEDEQIPAEHSVSAEDVPGASTTEEPVDESSGSRPQKTRTALILAAALIALPGIYLLANHWVATPVHSAPRQTAGTDIASLEALVNASPTNDNRINLSIAYINGGSASRAIPILQSVVAEDKSNVVAWNDLCVAHTLQKDYDNAIEECNKALLISPSFQLARNNRQWAQDEKNKSLGVKEDAVSRDAAFYVKDGLKQYNLGFYDQAIGSWQHALELDPSSASAENNIGTAYMMKKHPAEALVWFNKAIALDPTLQIAKNNLAWAQQEQAKDSK
jgi:tetratricopeptide (TPR) repeat protein